MPSLSLSLSFSLSVLTRIKLIEMKEKVKINGPKSGVFLEKIISLDFDFFQLKGQVLDTVFEGRFLLLQFFVLASELLETRLSTLQLLVQMTDTRKSC